MTTRVLGYGSLVLLAIATYGIFFVAGPISGEGDAGPIVYMSSYWWRTLHPPPAIGPLAQAQPSTTIVWILLLSLVAFTVLYAFLVRVRVEIEETDAAVALRGELLSGARA